MPPGDQAWAENLKSAVQGCTPGLGVQSGAVGMCFPATDKRFCNDREAGGACKRFGQNFCLVVAAQPLPQGREGNRHDEVAGVEDSLHLPGFLKQGPQRYRHCRGTLERQHRRTQRAGVHTTRTYPGQRPPGALLTPVTTYNGRAVRGSPVAAAVTYLEVGGVLGAPGFPTSAAYHPVVEAFHQCATLSAGLRGEEEQHGIAHCFNRSPYGLLYAALDH